MKELTLFEGLSVDENLVDVEHYESDLDEALSFVASLRHDLNSNALASAIHTVDTLLMDSETKCTLSHPPESMRSIVDSTGDIVWRCFHNPYHEWDLIGNRKK